MIKRKNVFWSITFTFCICLLLCRTVAFASELPIFHPRLAVSKAAALSGSCGNDAFWSLSVDGSLVISGSGPMKDAATALAVPWFACRDVIKRISISEGITYIGSYAFYGCRQVTQISLPDSVIGIGDHAFQYCEVLTSFLFPKQLTQIGERILQGCYGLNHVEYLSVDAAGPDNRDINAFALCGALTEIEIGPDVRYLPDGLFRACKAVTEIVLPNGLEEIGDRVFSECVSLARINLPVSLNRIGEQALYGCEKLTGPLTIPAGVTALGGNAFAYCTSLNEVRYECARAVVIGAGPVFSACPRLARVELGAQVREIPSLLFRDCGGLERITIPAGVERIGESAFLNCTKLEEVSYEAVCCEIDKAGLFPGCNMLRRFQIGALVRVLPGIFADCQNLIEIDLPFGVQTISQDAFYNCVNLQQIYIPASVTDINGNPFLGCEKLRLILGNNGSAAAEFASLHGIPFMDQDYFQVWKKGNICALFGQAESLPNETIRKSVTVRAEENLKLIRLTVRYHPDFMALSQVGARDFKIVNLAESPGVCSDGRIESVVTAQVDADRGSWPAGEFSCPLSLSFTVRQDTPISMTEVEIVPDESYYVTSPGERLVYFDSSLRDSLQILPQKAKEIQISGPALLSVPSSYEVSFIPAYTTDKTVQWKVGHPEIAEVTQDGRLYPKQNGRTYIQVQTLDGSRKEARYPIEVVAPPPEVSAESLAIDGKTELSGPERYVAVIEPDDVMNRVLFWSVSNPEIALVDQNGLVIPLKEGEVTLSVQTTDGSGLAAHLTIRVVSLPAMLDGLVCTAGCLLPAFRPEQFEYELWLPAGQLQAAVTAEFESGALTCGGRSYDSGENIPILLSDQPEGEMILELMQDGMAGGEYRIMVRRTEELPARQTLYARRNQSELGAVSFDLFRMGMEAPEAAVFLALYDGNGRMLEMRCCPMELDGLWKNQIRLNIEGLDPKRYQLMLWDSAGGMRPIGEAETVNLY